MIPAQEGRFMLQTVLVAVAIFIAALLVFAVVKLSEIEKALRSINRDMNDWRYRM
jgi:hypothetical protein